MTMEVYRIWLKNGTYEVAVESNRERAINKAVREKNVNREDIVAVGKATSRGRLFKV